MASRGQNQRLTLCSSVLILGILTFLGTWALHSATLRESDWPGTFWPSSGLLAAALLSTRRRTWPLFILSWSCSTLVALLPSEFCTKLAIAHAFAEACGALVLSLAVKRWFNGREFLNSGKATCAFIGCSIVVSLVSATALQAPILMPTLAEKSQHAFPFSFNAFLLSYLLITPFSIATLNAWRDRKRSVVTLRTSLEAALLLLLVMASAFQIFSLQAHELGYLPFPFLLWAVYRFGLPGTTAFNLLFACAGIATQKIFDIEGGFAQRDTLWTQGYLATTALTGMILAALHTEWRTARRRREAAEERYRLAIDAIDDAVWDWDVKLNTCIFSNRWYTMLGYAPQELPATFETWRSLLHPDDAERAVKTAAANAQTGTPFSMEFRLRTKEGSYRWVEARGRCIENDSDGSPRRIMGTHTDVNERHRLTEELHHQAERLHLAMEGGNLGVWDLDMRSSIISIGRRYSDAEKPEAGVQRKLANAFDEIHPEDRPHAIRRFNAHVNGESDYYESEHRVRMSSENPWHWVHARGLIVSRDADGKPLRMVGTTQDISARRHLEEQLLRSQKMDAIGHLAGGIAHDFNNLLHVILGYCEMLKQEGDLSKEAEPMVEQIIGAGERAEALVGQLLTFSRRGHVMRKDLLDMNVIVGDFKKMLHRVIGSHIELNVALEAALPLIEGDRGQIEQVLMNLSVNARDAMPDGGSLRIKTKLLQSESPTREDHSKGTYVCIIVSDTGHGMPDQVQRRIFDPFFSTKDVGKGTGLGLSTAYAIVQRHHGFIDVSSGPGTGTIFRVFLPVCEHEVEVGEIEAKVVPDADNGSGETILIAEEEEMVRGLCSQILRKAGYKLLVTDDGEKALALFKKHSDEVSLLLLDMMLPHLPGWKVAEEARQIRPSVPVLFCSGNDHSDRITDGTPLLRKPYRPREILSMVQALIHTVEEPETV